MFQRRPRGITASISVRYSYAARRSSLLFRFVKLTGLFVYRIDGETRFRMEYCPTLFAALSGFLRLARVT